MKTEHPLIRRLTDNIEQVIIGKTETVTLVLLALLSEGHILIEDIPGVGKTSLVAALAKSLDCSFKRIQFTADVMPSDVTGYSVYNPKSGTFEFREGAVHTQFLLADEINRTSPKTQASLLEAMEENQVTVDGETYRLPRPFMVMATQNPVEYLGTYPLPEAQLDRFFMKISLGYPGRQDEKDILVRYKETSPMDTLRPVASGVEVIALQQAVRQIFVHDSLADYIVDIVSETRQNPYVLLGGSPRASLYLFRAAQARALMQNRDFVVPEDIKYVAPSVLAHRLVLKPEYKSEDASRQVVASAIETVKIPLIEKSR